MENSRKLDGRNSSAKDRVQHIRNSWTSKKYDDGSNSLLCNGDVSPVVNENRAASFRPRRSMKYALEWLDTVRPERKDSKTEIAGQSGAKVEEDETCVIRVKPVPRSRLKGLPSMRPHSAKKHSKYRENLRESQTIRSRIHDSFLRYWNQAQRSIALTEETRDLVPLRKAEIFEYEGGEKSGKVVHLEKQRKRTNVDLCHPLLHPFLEERRESTQGVIKMNREAIVIYRRNGNRRINDWQNYQFQQIAIGKAELDLQLGDDTKRSSSETRGRLSSRQMCIKRSRRSKFHCEPVRLGRSVSIEFKKFDEIREMFHRDRESNSIMNRNMNENSFNWKSNEVRLRSNAEKKLNLFKEMKKSGRHRRRRFQDRSVDHHITDGHDIAESSNSNEETVDGEEDGKGKGAFNADNSGTVESAFDLPLPKSEEQVRHKENNERETSMSFSHNDNDLPASDFPESSKTLTKSLALYKLRDVMDDFDSDEEKSDESPDTPRGDRSDRFTFGKHTTDSSELEELMLKLKTSLKNCSESLKPGEASFCERTKISELLTADDEFLDCIIPRKVPPIIAYPASTARSYRNGRGAYRRCEESKSTPRCKNMRRDWDLRESRRVVSPLSRSEEARQLVMTALSQELDQESEKESVENIFSLNGLSESPSEKVPETKSKSLKSRKTMSFKDDMSMSSGLPRSCATTSVRHKSSVGGVETKIYKLECRLRDMLRKIGRARHNDQIAIKRCLERLRETSEAVLKRLKSERYCGDCGDVPRLSMRDSRGYQSEPDSAAVRESSDKKSIILKASGSEIQLNVGMEITMENYDPVTGKKLQPEENRDFEQQGNIQCKLVKPGSKPVTFIDTDFSYNPRTGMLFQKAQSMNHKYSACESKDRRPTKTYVVSKTTKRNFPADSDSESSFGKSEALNRVVTQHLKSIKYGEQRSSSLETSKSALADPFALAIEREEIRNMRRLRQGMETSRSYPRENTRCPARQCKRRVLLHPQFEHGGREVGTQAELKIIGEKRIQPTYHLRETVQDTRTNENGDEMVMVSDKGVQTHLGTRKKSSASVTRRSMGVQAEFKHRPKVLVNRSADTTFLGTPLWALRRGVNVSVQTSSTELALRSSDVSSQTDFLIEEAQKYMRDLETQKRVNLAIAELCYHLSNGSEA